MIRAFEERDLGVVMQIWLDANIEAHPFVPREYWTSNYELVHDMLPQAEVYVFEDDVLHQLDGFIGLSDGYIAGVFVRSHVRSKGIGKHLLDHVKSLKPCLSLNVYRKNTRAVQFYQREGFSIQSENTDEGTGQREYMMVWSRE